MSTQVEVERLPQCDIPGCGTVAGYDGKTNWGPWAYMCEDDFRHHGVGLGTGKGQRLILRSGDDKKGET